MSRELPLIESNRINSKLRAQVNEVWELSDKLCDFYVAVDVTCSTASILNLVAISIDR